MEFNVHMSNKFNKNTILKFLNDYKNIFEKINENNLKSFDSIINENVNFEDPFNKIIGKENFISIFKDMFKKIENPRFFVLDLSVSDLRVSEGIGYIRWTLKGKFKKKHKEFSIDGMSEVKFDQSGKVLIHIDHWDSLTQLITKIPIVGNIVKLILKFFNI